MPPWGGCHYGVPTLLNALFPLGFGCQPGALAMLIDCHCFPTFFLCCPCLVLLSAFICCLSTLFEIYFSLIRRWLCPSRDPLSTQKLHFASAYPHLHIVDIDAAPTRSTAAVDANHPAWGLSACRYGTIAATAIGAGTDVLPLFVLPPSAFSFSQFPPCILSFSLFPSYLATSLCIPVTIPVAASSDGAHGFSPFPRTSLS